MRFSNVDTGIHKEDRNPRSVHSCNYDGSLYQERPHRFGNAVFDGCNRYAPVRLCSFSAHGGDLLLLTKDSESWDDIGRFPPLS